MSEMEDAQRLTKMHADLDVGGMPNKADLDWLQDRQIEELLLNGFGDEGKSKIGHAILVKRPARWDATK